MLVFGDLPNLGIYQDGLQTATMRLKKRRGRFPHRSIVQRKIVDESVAVGWFAKKIQTAARIGDKVVGNHWRDIETWTQLRFNVVSVTVSVRSLSWQRAFHKTMTLFFSPEP